MTSSSSLTAVRTRFAPSPTGDLHLGSARTALFNWLYARHCQGVYKLRIEDTDRARSTPQALATILDGLSWLGITHQGEAVSQYHQAPRHKEVAEELVRRGRAYYCYCTPQELEAMRAQATQEGRPAMYDGRWRDRDPQEAPSGIAPVIRLKAQREGVTRLEDAVQGVVEVANSQLDDMVLLRSDGTPTYMLAVVVDDHDMGITQVIRGDDHLTNTFRQLQIYGAMGWEPPKFAHIPLIHGPDGAKLSKRHGATSVGAYADMGILPEAMCNYLLRLGWSHGDDEIISQEQAIAWFNLEAIVKSPARFDVDKLLHLNGHYMRLADPQRLVDLITPALTVRKGSGLTTQEKNLLLKGMPGLQQRARTVVELADNAWFYLAPLPLSLTAQAQTFCTPVHKGHLQAYENHLVATKPTWDQDALLASTRGFVETQTPALKMRDFSQVLRVALTGATVSPSVFDIMEVLGPEATTQRFQAWRCG